MADVNQEDRAQLEALVSEAMEIARQRTGLTAEAWARRLRPALHLPDATPEMKVRNNWYSWRSKPWTVPAVALLAAARVAEVPLDELVAAAAQSVTQRRQDASGPPEPAEPSSEGRLARLEREVAEQQRLIDELREEIDRRATRATGRDDRRQARS
jgi:hypothetical protein